MSDRETEAVRLLRAGFNARQTAAVMGITLGAANGIRFRRSGMVVTPLSTDEIEAARARIRSGARPAEAKPKPANEAEPTAAADILLAAARAAVSARRDGGIVRSATKRPPVVESLPPLLAASVVAAPEQDDPWSDINIAALREMWGNLEITISEIGRRLGKSKDSVKGKAHRLDLPPRPSPIIRRDPDEPAPAPRAAPVLRAAAQTLPAMLAMAHMRDLRTPMQPVGRAPRCQFPLWPHDAPRPLMDPKFCGEPSAIGSYCLEHASACYKPHPVRWGGA